MKKTLMTAITASLIALPMLAVAAESGAPQTCEVFADTMTRRVVDIFHDKKQNEEQKRQALSSLFQEAVDTDWIGKFVLGRFWNDASAADRTDYLTSYRSYLTAIYVSKFNDDAGFSVDAIKIASIKPDGANHFIADTQIQRKGDEDVKVSYALEQSPGKCRVHDIKVEGISLLSSQRSEFSSLAGKSGIKGVIDAMQEQLTE